MISEEIRSAEGCLNSGPEGVTGRLGARARGRTRERATVVTAVRQDGVALN